MRTLYLTILPLPMVSDTKSFSLSLEGDDSCVVIRFIFYNLQYKKSKKMMEDCKDFNDMHPLLQHGWTILNIADVRNNIIFSIWMQHGTRESGMTFPDRTSAFTFCLHIPTNVVLYLHQLLVLVIESAVSVNMAYHRSLTSYDFNNFSFHHLIIHGEVYLIAL